MWVLDTNVVLDLMGRNGRRNLLAAQMKLGQPADAGPTQAITRFTRAELFVGVHLAKDAAKSRQAMESVLAGRPVLEFTEDAALAYGRITAHLRRIGRPTGQIDALIAAVTLANGQTLVTRNPKHFADVPGLAVESY